MTYELHIGTFTRAAPSMRLSSGSTISSTWASDLEVPPINAFNGDHGWGMTAGWFAVHEPYGGPDGFVRSVDACHARGLGVIVDAVYNHISDHPATTCPDSACISPAERTIGDPRSTSPTPIPTRCAFIIESALRWFRDFGADALLRLIAVHALMDHRAVHILEELAGGSPSCPMSWAPVVADRRKRPERSAAHRTPGRWRFRSRRPSGTT